MSGAPHRGPERSDETVGRVFFEDLRRTRFQRDYWRELLDLYHFYLDEDERTRLAGMSRLRRAISILTWSARNLMGKFSPARRLLVVVSLAMTIAGWSRFSIPLIGWEVSADFRPWGWLLLLLVLMLELKDKLVAKDEIQIARSVQVALLPRENPEIPGWSVWCYSRPANDVGGDLVDYIELDGFRHGIVLGDVAGKGLGAALLSAKLQATLRALVPEAASLDDLGRRTNDIFHRDGIDNRFATLFYAEIEHDSGQMRYLNAGHNPAFLVRRDGHERLTSSSFPLGMLPEADYREGTTDLLPGDLLLVYSDGLSEGENAAGEEFGEERIERLLPTLRGREPDEIGDLLLKEVDRFLGDTRPGDDLSLVVVVRR